jgi:phosphatidate phosphatase APP1
MLRDIGLHNEAPLDHKSACIRQILATYPDLPLVLVGDTGERDPDIYLEVAAQHPGRVRAIYIREVGTGPLRHREVAALAEQARRLGCEMLLLQHAHEALAHARLHALAR